MKEDIKFFFEGVFWIIVGTVWFILCLPVIILTFIFLTPFALLGKFIKSGAGTKDDEKGEVK